MVMAQLACSCKPAAAYYKGDGGGIAITSARALTVRRDLITNETLDLSQQPAGRRSIISLFEVDRRLDADALEIVVEPFLGARAA
jgi:hypothetical protein